jgi:hypothetical protein
MADTRHPTYIPSPLLHQCRIMLELTGVARIVRIIIVPPFLGYSRHVTCVPTSKPLPKGKANGKPCCFACTKPISYANRIICFLSQSPPSPGDSMATFCHSISLLSQGVQLYFVSRVACRSCVRVPRKKNRPSSSFLK